MSNGCVAIWYKMLTYFVYAPLLNQIGALPLNISYYLETESNNNKFWDILIVEPRGYHNPYRQKRENSLGLVLTIAR